jgi:phage shock protein PspC (stress-responsive transcriptional regulator)
VVAGVAGGLGDAFGVDPAIFRLTFVTLTFFGGGGLVLYALGWLFMPPRDSQESIGERMLRRAGGPRSAGGIALIAVAVLIFVNTLGNVGGGLVWGAVMIAIGVLVFRSDGSGTVPGFSAGSRGAAAAPSGAPPSTTTAPAMGRRPSTAEAARPAAHRGGAVGTAPPPDAPPPPTTDTAPPDDAALHEAALRELDAHTAAYAVPPPTIPPPVVDDGWRPRPLAPQPPPPRPPSILGRVTVAAMLIAIGALALFDNLTALDVAIASYAAVALLIVGGGLLVGAVVGRARGLIPLGIVALVIMLVAGLAPQLPNVPAGGAGDRVYVPETVADLQSTYQLSAGQLRLDLTRLELEPGDDIAVDVTMGVGQMTVLVPPDVGVDVDAEMQLGAVDALGRTSEGPGAQTAFAVAAGEGAPTVDLDLVNGIGEIEVRRVEPTEAS